MLNINLLKKRTMSDETRQAVIMTDEEKAEFEAFRKEKARKAKLEK